MTAIYDDGPGTLIDEHFGIREDARKAGIPYPNDFVDSLLREGFTPENASKAIPRYVMTIHAGDGETDARFLANYLVTNCDFEMVPSIAFSSPLVHYLIDWGGP